MWENLRGCLCVFLSVSALCLGFAAPCQSETLRLISDSELNSLLSSCQTARAGLVVSQDNLKLSQQTQQFLESELQARQKVIDSLLQKSESLEISSKLSLQDSEVLRQELEALRRSFDGYKAAVQLELLRSNVIFAVGGAVAGAAVGLIVTAVVQGVTK